MKQNILTKFNTISFVLLFKSEPAQMELLGAVLNNDGSVVLGNNERIVIADTIRFLWEVSIILYQSQELSKGYHTFIRKKLKGRTSNMGCNWYIIMNTSYRL